MFKSNSLKYLIIGVLSLTIFQSCKKSEVSSDDDSEKLFTSLNANDTGVDFINVLQEDIDVNYFQYNYTYIGGGVATADFNNDGLVDLFFTSNTHKNKLYLNKGNLKFEDITDKAGITTEAGFNTGVTVADVNNDGFMDIYISRGGWDDSNNKFANKLFINNGNLTFTEKGEELGVADKNRSINAVFFDYDNDNDLDLYVSNTPDMTAKPELVDFITIKSNPTTISKKGSDKLYNNDGTGHFTDVSVKAGIVPDIGFGLNPTVGDLNNDGYLDIYVCNDFNIPDFAYINNGNGTFTDKRNQVVKHMSFNSMGGDIADINNDGLLDLMTLDMNPEDYIRSKTTMGMTSKENFDEMVQKDHHYQYMHNMLQLNNGNGTFSEISKMAGIANTDWSWAILSADFDLDGFNDIYVTNGVYRDVIDKDKNNEILAILKQNQRKPTKEDFLSFAKMLPQQKLTNYFYKNNGDLTFEDTSKKWNNAKSTFSNGAAYADLDNDGDLDLVVNNINEAATILKNNSRELDKGSFLAVNLKGPKTNPFGVGTKVNLLLKSGAKQTRQLINTKGFLSAVSNQLHFGFKNDDAIKQLEIIWPDGKKQIVKNSKSNEVLVVNYANASSLGKITATNATVFSKVPFNFKHVDPTTDDYKYQILLPHKLSQTGPAIAKADVNNDGVEDIYIGGGHSQAGQLLLGNKNNLIGSSSVAAFTADKEFEDVGACFFDADNDGDQDLYVVSGSYEFDKTPKLLQDRLYLNDGKGQFKRALNNLPEMISAGSVVTPCDYDNDGDIDLFVGGRVIPNKYPYAPESFLLINNKGVFTNETQIKARKLQNIGMVTDAVWFDIDNDKKLDLIVCGEWMGIEVFLNTNGSLIQSNSYKSLSDAKGWWNKLLVADVDNDGDMDLVAGNLGLNYKFHATAKKPFHVYTHDFDYDGVEDIFLANEYKNKTVPVRGKSCTAQQMPHLKNKITSYNNFASADLKGIVGGAIDSALHYVVNEFRSGIFINNGQSKFVFEPFSNEVQVSPINSILFEDFDGDGRKDLLMAGNNYMAEIETTRSDAGLGYFLKKNSDKGFTFVPSFNSGFFANKDVRNCVSIKNNNSKYVLVANNNDTHDLFKVTSKK
ncbi:VCBS repeat-containing protein [Flavobacterium sp. NG2]|uniref:VCBS repeat-containing protein n=1 Tax=Flavobacterium sp. NG2 TaxID=3097547 RepID=UPI002A815482|nr:VCBS repeat-containing protein [Flavobacterium sp. NG2]WPR73027.1 VCBS repeat-containing protein [Flavobacterium sp. NG2]